MFKQENRYVSRQVNEVVPIQIQILMWSMIDSLKEKKKLDTLNCGVGTRVQRRENVGGSLNLWSPRDVFTSVIGFCPFDDLEYSTLKSIRQVFCQKNFLYY